MLLEYGIQKDRTVILLGNKLIYNLYSLYIFYTQTC